MITLKEIRQKNSEERLEEDKIVAQKYRLMKKLGAGGYGSVWLAEDMINGNRIAIKLLDLFRSKDDYAVGVLKNEFSILKELNHPNICKIYDFGFDDCFGAYLVSEYINGCNFLDATKDKPAGHCEELFVQTLRALAYLHSMEIFHFDIKPQNIIVRETANGQAEAVLIDFGVASVCAPKDTVGTYGFMAPEMILKQAPDGRADLYSMGVLLYAALAGQNPFEDITPDAIMRRHLDFIPPSISKAGKGVPKHLDGIINNLLQKNPSDRWQGATEVLRNLNAAAGKKYVTESEDTKFSYIPADGRLIGRKGERRIINDFLDAGQGGVLKITGGYGVGKTRLMRDLKYTASLRGLHVLDLWRGDEKEMRFFMSQLGNIPPLSGKPAVVTIDNFDGICDNVAARPLIDMINISLARGEARTLFVFASKRSLKEWSGTEIRLNNFSGEEIREYVSSFADPPEDITELIVNETLKRTRGNPALVKALFNQLVRRDFFVDGGAGRWSRSLFEDVDIVFDAVEVPVAVARPVLEVMKKLGSGEAEALKIIAVSGGVLLPETDVSKYHGLIKYDFRKNCHVFVDDFARQVVLQTLSDNEKALLHDTVAVLLKQKGAAPHEIDEHLAYGGNLQKAHQALIRLVKYERHNGLAVRAVERLNDALKSDNSDSELSLELGECYFHLKNFDKVHELCYKAAGQQLKLLQCRAFIEQGRFAEAAKGLKKIKNSPGGKNYLARIEMLKGNFSNAVKIYRQVRAGAARLPLAERALLLADNELGEAYRLWGKSSAAIKALNAEAKMFLKVHNYGRLMRRYYSIAEAFRMTKKYKDAIHAFERAIKIEKKEQAFGAMARIYNGYGGVLLAQNKPREAISKFENGLTLAFKAGDLFSAAVIMANIGRTYCGMGDKKQAERYFTDADLFLKRLSPKSAMVKELKRTVRTFFDEI